MSPSDVVPPSHVFSLADDTYNEANEAAAHADKAATVYSAMRLGLGVPAAVLAGTAGFTALADISPWIPAVCGFAAGILGTLQTFIPSEKRARQYRLAAVDFTEIGDRAHRVARSFDRSADADRASEESRYLDELEDIRRDMRRLQRELVGGDEDRRLQAAGPPN
jgi:hypothetical protein